MATIGMLDIDLDAVDFAAAHRELISFKIDNPRTRADAVSRTRAIAAWGNWVDDSVLAFQRRLREHTEALASLDASVGTLEDTVAGLGSGVIHRNTTLVTVTSTTAETDIMNYTIPAGTMTTNGEMIRFRIWADHRNIGGSRNLRMRWYVDGVLVLDSGAVLSYGSNTAVHPMHTVAELVSLGEDLQALYITQTRNSAATSAPVVGIGTQAASAVPSASAGDVAAVDRADPITVRCTVQHAESISNIVTRRHAFTVALE